MSSNNCLVGNLHLNMFVNKVIVNVSPLEIVINHSTSLEAITEQVDDMLSIFEVVMNFEINFVDGSHRLTMMISFCY
jgi:hypothetical protein